MGTRSFIAHQTATGVQGIYCHWDGYLSHNGQLLKKHYQEPVKIKALVALGDLSSLAADVGSQHNFKTLVEGQCTFYHRDRDENWEHCQPKQFTLLEEALQFAEGCGCEYFYLFDGKAWHYAERGAQFFGLGDGSPFSEFQPIPEVFEDT